MIAKAEDFLVRRTGALYFDIGEVKNYKEAVANHIASYFHWSESEKEYSLKLIDNLMVDF